MGKEKKRKGSCEAEAEAVAERGGGEEKRKKSRTAPSEIKNKEKRSAVHAKLKREKKILKRKQAKARDAAYKKAIELGEEPPEKKVPRTIENTREPDETVCRPDDEERGLAFIEELKSVIPNAHDYARGTYDLKKIVEYAKRKDFTAIINVHTNRREPDGLYIIKLPDGPTAHFKLSNLVLRKDIKNHGNPTSHKPELVLNNFTTRLGNRIGRLIQSLFPQEPDFRGRRVVTFHNQRDFIFFRHHRYIFDAKEKKEDSKGKATQAAKGKNLPEKKVIARLQRVEEMKYSMYCCMLATLTTSTPEKECGPRFTLKLISLQHGTFDTKGGEHEWVHKPEMDTSRRRFFL
ncbi:ribosome production factor 1 isoform X3 [Ananas comosus]|uniref:Ribosome production factor 1 isoform X3 n=1 Tax=Ananas comosus TaxID=4615 RepID=A0A6P5H5G6_ANACO|nr:ribosome production factor 1 isoform X3 [Ananas comosus]